MSSQENHWVIIKGSSQKGKVIETTELWGTSVLTVWIPNSDAILRPRPEEVEPASGRRGEPSVGIGAGAREMKQDEKCSAIEKIKKHLPTIPCPK